MAATFDPTKIGVYLGQPMEKLHNYVLQETQITFQPDERYCELTWDGSNLSYINMR